MTQDIIMTDAEHLSEAFAQIASGFKAISDWVKTHNISLNDQTKSTHDTVPVASSEEPIAASDSQPAKRHRKPRDPDAPKQPMSAYLLFSHHVRNILKEEMPQIQQSELFAEIGKRWRDASDDDKLPFEEAAAKLKFQYQQDLEAYKSGKRKFTELEGSDQDEEISEEKAPAAEAVDGDATVSNSPVPPATPLQKQQKPKKKAQQQKKEVASTPIVKEAQPKPSGTPIVVPSPSATPADNTTAAQQAKKKRKKKPAAGDAAPGSPAPSTPVTKAAETAKSPETTPKPAQTQSSPKKPQQQAAGSPQKPKQQKKNKPKKAVAPVAQAPAQA